MSDPLPGARWTWALCLACAGCADTAVFRAALDGADVAALVVTDDQDRPLRVLGMFAPGDPASPSAVLAADERAYVVGASFERLRAVEPSLRAALWDTLALERGAPPSALERSPHGRDLRARFALPADTLVVDPERGAPPASLLGALTAEVTIEGDDPGGLALRSFGAAASLVEPEGVLPGEGGPSTTGRRVVRVFPLSEDRLLVVGTRFVTLVARGEPLHALRTPGRPSPYLSLGDFAVREGVAIATDVAVNREHTRAWVSGYAGDDGYVWAIDLRPDGLLAAATATLTPSARWPRPPPLRAISRDARGALIAGGDEASLYVAEPGSALFVARPRLLENHEEWVRRNVGSIATVTKIVSTSNSLQPHMVGVESGRVIVGDAARETWNLVLDASVLTNVAEPHVTGMALDELSGEAWVTTRGGGVMHRASTEAAWRRAPVEVPGALDACATGDPLGGYSLDVLFDVALDDTHAYIVIAGCTSLVRVRRADGVSSAVHREGELAGRTEDTEPRTVVLGSGGAPVVAGGRITVHEVRE